MLNQVLEHVKHPITLLKRIFDLLKDDGILYIEVPGFDTVFKEQIDPRLIFKNAHRHFFCLDSLSRVVSQAGFEILEGNETVRAILRKKNKLQSEKNRSSTKTFKPSVQWTQELLNASHQQRFQRKGKRNISFAILTQKLIRWLRKKIIWYRLRSSMTYATDDSI